MIALRTFGALELTSTDGNVVRSVLAQPRRAALLCYLALATPRGFHRRDTLFALFWPEHDAEQARHALRQSVYFLRRALGPMAIVSRGGDELSLASGHVRCDVWEFASALGRGRLMEALALYRGELLAGFHISDAPEFERWAEAERSRLRGQAREAAWTLALAREREGDASGAAEAARRAAALVPTDEIAFRRLAVLLERIGDRAGAVRAYEAFTSRLREEYELEPSAETQGLVARIRAEAVERYTIALGHSGEAGSRAGDEASLAVGQDSAGPEDGSRPLALPLRPKRARRGMGLVAGAVTAALVLGLAWLQVRAPSGKDAADIPPVPIREPAPAIAVLPFVTRDDSLAHWREGLMDLVSINLGGIPGLRALDGRTVLARWREAVRDPDVPSSATALEVAERAGGRYAVAGSVIAQGPDLLLTAGVHELAGRRMLGTAKARGPADSIFTLVDHLTLEILRLIPGGDRRERARIDLARVNTASLPALMAFLEGEVRFRRSQFESAAKAYGRAVEADSTFALARYRLGNSRQWFWTDWTRAVPDPLAPAVGRFVGRLPPREAAMFRAFQLRDEDVSAARDLLEEEARRHPEDAETWYQLGEFYHHSGEKALAPPGAGDRALDRAIALDSTYSLPYIHRIESAIRGRDTAGADRLLRTFARLAPDTRHLVQLRLLAGLVVGDSIARSTSEAALDTLEINRLFWLGFQLARTGRWDLSEQAFRTIWDRGEVRGDAAMPLFFTCLGQGKTREAYRWVNDPFTPQSQKPRMLDALAEVGTSIPAAELDAILRLKATGGADAVELFYLASLAASQARWRIVQGTLEQLRSRARSLGAAGDSSAAHIADAMAQGLEGYVAWRQGDRDQALPLLQSSQRRALGGHGVNDLLRWWLGRLLVEMGRPREALTYFESQWGVSGGWLPADYERGRLYAQVGMAKQAREAYASFLAPRQQADSAVQPMVQAARAALERLSPGAP
jgi:DNA-binding SARP family transcriptional activator/TolB-like protein